MSSDREREIRVLKQLVQQSNQQREVLQETLQKELEKKQICTQTKQLAKENLVADCKATKSVWQNANGLSGEEELLNYTSSNESFTNLPKAKANEEKGPNDTGKSETRKSSAQQYSRSMTNLASKTGYYSDGCDRKMPVSSASSSCTSSFCGSKFKSPHDSFMRHVTTISSIYSSTSLTKTQSTTLPPLPLDHDYITSPHIREEVTRKNCANEKLFEEKDPSKTTTCDASNNSPNPSKPKFQTVLPNTRSIEPHKAESEMFPQIDRKLFANTQIQPWPSIEGALQEIGCDAMDLLPTKRENNPLPYRSPTRRSVDGARKDKSCSSISRQTCLFKEDFSVDDNWTKPNEKISDFNIDSDSSTDFLTHRKAHVKSDCNSTDTEDYPLDTRERKLSFNLSSAPFSLTSDLVDLNMDEAFSDYDFNSDCTLFDFNEMLSLPPQNNFPKEDKPCFSVRQDSSSSRIPSNSPTVLESPLIDGRVDTPTHPRTVDFDQLSPSTALSPQLPFFDPFLGDDGSSQSSLMQDSPEDHFASKKNSYNATSFSSDVCTMDSANSQSIINPNLL